VKIVSGRDERKNRLIEHTVYEGILTHNREWTGDDDSRVATRIGEEFVCWGYFAGHLRGKYVRVSIAVLEE
jgi:hypothetical protein